MADLLPPIDQLTAPFWEGARQGELRVQRCPVTRRLIFPPRELSPHAAGAVPEWTAVSGRGTIWSFAVPHPPLLPPFSELERYNVICVALDEDPRVRLIGNLVTARGGAIDEIDPHQIQIGARVRVVFEPQDDEIHLPRWEPEP